MARATSSPLRAGMRWSRTTTSGRHDAHRTRAWSPSAASPTTSQRPSTSSVTRINNRMSGLSSAMSVRITRSPRSPVSFGTGVRRPPRSAGRHKRHRACNSDVFQAALAFCKEQQRVAAQFVADALRRPPSALDEAVRQVESRSDRQLAVLKALRPECLRGRQSESVRESGDLIKRLVAAGRRTTARPQAGRKVRSERRGRHDAHRRSVGGGDELRMVWTEPTAKGRNHPQPGCGRCHRR
jgi:hypothetical protein